MFAVDKSGKLNFMWQTKRHGDWNKWTPVLGSQSQALTTLANVMDDKTGWWVAFGVSIAFVFVYFKDLPTLLICPL